MQWVQNPAGPGEGHYWPRTQRGDLVKLGYIAANSIHSTGAAVDVTLVALPIFANRFFRFQGGVPGL
jgi:D-alanyl-D-alanine dipeptidase